MFLATPSPLRLRDIHAKRWLGDLFRRDGYPWASPPWSIRAMLADFERIEVNAWVLARALGVPERVVPRALGGAFGWTSRWQKLLARKPA
jgi:hypothetical protein